MSPAKRTSLLDYLRVHEGSSSALRFYPNSLYPSSDLTGAHKLSYSDLIDQVSLARSQFTRLGVQVGDCVAMLCANEPEILISLFALNDLGACLLPMNFRLAPAEWVAVLEDAQAGLAIVAEEFAAPWQASQANIPSVSLEAWRSGELTNMKIVSHSSDRRHRDALDLALLVYTSGTTGKPKGVMHSTEGLLANARASWHAHSLTANDSVLSALPLFHVGGLCIQTLPALLAGASVSLLKRFEPELFLRVAEQDQSSVTLVVPAVMQSLLAHPHFASVDLSALRLCMAGSSIVAPNLIEGFHTRGLVCGQVYGSTETGPVSICLGRDAATERVGAVGWPALGVEARLDLLAAGTDGVGELLLRAPNLALGYWRDSENLAFADGWFRTGDLARKDGDGCYWVVGRCKDMIISGGENIYPAELEMLIAKFPEVADCAAVGIPHARWSESLCLAVELKAGFEASAFSLNEVHRRLDGRLAKFKWPAELVLLQSFPRTALGKIQKSSLREQLLCR